MTLNGGIKLHRRFGNTAFFTIAETWEQFYTAIKRHFETLTIIFDR